MEFQNLEIYNFGKFHKKKIELAPGINLIHGENEAGKTTIYHFLKGMLFGMEKARGRGSGKEPYTRYEPWENPAEYGGRLRFRKEGKNYRLERSFSRNNRRSILVCEDTGEKIRPDEENMCRLLEGVSKDLYEETMSVSQLKSEPGMSLAGALQNHAANYYGAGSALDVTMAMRTLKKQQKDNAASQNVLIRDHLTRRREVEIQAENINRRLEKSREILREKKLRFHNIAPDREKMRSRVENLEGEDLRLEELELELRDSLEKIRDTGSTLEEQLKGAVLERDRNHVRNQLLMETTAEQNRRNSRKGLLFMICGGILLLAGLMLLIMGKTLPGILLLLPGIGLPVWGLFCLRNSHEILPQEYPENDEKVRELQSELERSDTMRKHMEDKIDSLLLRQNQIREERKALWQEKQESDSAQGLLEGEIRQLQETVAELQAESINFKEQLDEYPVPREENLKLREEQQAIQLAQERIAKLAETMRKRFGTDLNERASSILSEITGGKYGSLVIDENLTMSLNTRDRLIPIGEVSRGTLEQVYLALRIGALEVMYGKNVPLILDDALVYYDDERLRAVLRWLEKSGKQVIMFSCQSREREIMDRERMKYRLVELG